MSNSKERDERMENKLYDNIDFLAKKFNETVSKQIDNINSTIITVTMLCDIGDGNINGSLRFVSNLSSEEAVENFILLVAKDIARKRGWMENPSLSDQNDITIN